MQGKLLEKTAMGQDAKILDSQNGWSRAQKSNYPGPLVWQFCSISKIVPVSSSFEKI